MLEILSNFRQNKRIDWCIYINNITFLCRERTCLPAGRYIRSLRVENMYSKFQKIDGTHPWRNVSPNGYEDYPVRYRKGGQVIFFNYSFAREMELIHKNTPQK